MSEILEKGLITHTKCGYTIVSPSLCAGGSGWTATEAKTVFLENLDVELQKLLEFRRAVELSTPEEIMKLSTEA